MPEYKKTYAKRRKAKIRVPFILLICVLLMGSVSALSFYFGEQAEKRTAAMKASKSVTVSRSFANNISTTSNTTFLPATATVSAVTAAILPSQVSLQAAMKPLLVHVSISTQNVTVYDAANQVVESFICSTGSPGYDTPIGTFSIYKRGTQFYSTQYGEGGRYYVAFYKDYYFHSIPVDKSGNIIPSVANDLGHEDSHGCVHLTMTDSKWMYDNIPNGTKVVIVN